MTTRYEWSLTNRPNKTKKCLAAICTALLASVALAAPSLGAVLPGNNITVFHEIDMVAVTGHELGEQISIDVVRNGVVIGTTSGPAVQLPDGEAGLEVNHEGTGEDDGSCWRDFTPDILPGDQIVVRSPEGAASAEGQESTPVLDVSLLEGPTEITADDPAAGLLAGDIVIEGVAADENGDRLPLAQLSSGMRDRDPAEFRAEPNYIEYKDATTNEWRAVYRVVNGAYPNADNRGNLALAQQREAILDADIGHEFAYESADLTVAMVSEGPSTGGPAVGCSAPREAYSVTSFDDEAVNIASGALVASGTTAAGTSSVEVGLSDGANSVSRTATVNGTTWTATFPRAALETLSDGPLTASGTYTLPDPNDPGATVDVTGATKEIQKDLVAPGKVTATPPGGFYASAQSVTLDSPEGDAQVRYTANGSDPTPTSGQVYNGRQIRVTADQTIKALAIDAAGNRGQVAAFEYTIGRKATRTSIVASTANLRLGRSRTISGSVSPNQVRGVVKLTIRKPGADVVRNLKLNNSRYRFTYKPPVVGRYTVQASFAQDVDNFASKSVVKSFRVVRR